MTSAIQTDALFKKFRRVAAVQGLTLNVPQGAVYALLGPNGAGKTTVIKILMNIIRSSSGRAEVLVSTPHVSEVGCSNRSAMFPKIRNSPSG